MQASASVLGMGSLMARVIDGRHAKSELVKVDLRATFKERLESRKTQEAKRKLVRYLINY